MKYLTSFIFAISVALFFSVGISPQNLLLPGLVPLFVPVFLLVNLVLLAVLALFKRKLLILPLIAIIIGWQFVGVTVQFNDQSQKEGLSVLSYNVHMFKYDKDKGGIRTDIIHWLQAQDADIMGFQEFYQNSSGAIPNAVKLLERNGVYDHRMQVVEDWSGERFFGLAIFSKYPIINYGTLFSNHKTNGAMYIDIKINQDTIRVYNVHLESMNIPAEQFKSIEDITKTYNKTLKKLNRGVLDRAQQVNKLVKHIKVSPYPVILLGDFNDVPYSYTYVTIREVLKNAFEAAGFGFGFTFNRVLFFLRIDNIFYSKVLNPLRFKTLRGADYSDHYPIKAVFSVHPLIQAKKGEQ